MHQYFNLDQLGNMAGQMPQISVNVYISRSIFYSLKSYKNKTQNLK